MAPFRCNVPPLGADIPSGAPNAKKRRKNGTTNMQATPNVQDLLPPPLSGYGDTIVASNPFDDCPSTMSANPVRNTNPIGMAPNMPPMGMNNMHMCRMNPQMGGMPPHHPHQNMMMNGPPRMNGPQMNGPPMGNPMGAHMIPSPNGHMHGPIPGPIQSPLGNMPPGGMQGPMQGNGPINGPMMSPMGPMNNGSPMGPMSSSLNGPINGPPGAMNGMSSPMNTPMNGMAGGMGSPMGGPPNCPISHVPNNSGSMNNNFMMPMYQKPLPVSAGKVYPADQPMVFNSQNPNAPPIYPCGVCHKEVHDNDQAILCESGCNFWFHRGCTGLTEAAFQLLTQEVYAEWVCDKCLSSKTIPLVKFKP